MELSDLIKLAGLIKSDADTPVQEQPQPSEAEGMRTMIALVTPEQLNQLQGETPMAEEMPGEATTEPDPQPYEGPLGSPADLSLRRYLGANGQPVNVDETKVYEDHKVEDITEAWQAYKIDEKKAKPDYIDIDGDGDKEESMKKAAKDKKEKAEESVEENQDISDLKKLSGIAEAPFPGEYDYTDPKYMDADGTPKSDEGPFPGEYDYTNYPQEDEEIKTIMMKHPEEVKKMKQTGDLDSGSELYMDLYSYYLDSGEMPYGTAKARDGDPVEFIMDRLDDLGMMEAKVEEEPNEGNAFTGAMAGKKKGEKFSVGGKTFTKEDEMIAKIKQLAGI